MLNSVLVRSLRKIHVRSLNDLYRNIIKLEWIAVAGLLSWLVVIFSIIIY
jgi:hypothetical protein